MPAAPKLLTISAWASVKRNLSCAQLRSWNVPGQQPL